jgi:adenylyltransferase/sulfurtransferase
MQANEVIKVITGIGEPLAGRLFLFDAASFTTRVLKVPKNPAIKIMGLIDYDQFCGIGTKEPRVVKSISVQEFDRMRKAGEDFQLIDVREPYEYEIVNLQGTLIPLASITSEQNKIARDKKVIIHCRTGKRSADAIRILEDQFGIEHLFNLEGGINKYAEEIDHSLSTY